MYGSEVAGWLVRHSRVESRSAFEWRGRGSAAGEGVGPPQTQVSHSVAQQQ